MPRKPTNPNISERERAQGRERQRRYMEKKRAGLVGQEKHGRKIKGGSAESKSSIYLATSIKHLYARRYVEDYLKNHPCVDCGFENPLALEFDHVKGKKVGNISEMVQLIPSKYDVKDLIDEIAKCEVRCSNCHQIRHRTNGA